MPTALTRVVVLAALAAGVIVLVPVALAHLWGSQVGLVGDEGGAGSVAGAASSTAEDAEGGPRDDGALAASPAHRTGLGFLDLDEPLERAVSALGPPDRRMADLNAAYTYTWDLAPGSELNVTADEQGITGLAARVPADPPVQVAAHADVVLGQSTPAEIADRWGEGHDVTRHPGEDFVLRYIECVGPFPVVIKFDQEPGGPPVRWDEPVTSVFIAYADAEPGTDGCPARGAASDG